MADMWRDLFSPFSLATIATILIVASLHAAYAQVMQSTNYQVQSDSINFGGGLSTSSNYVLESTAGELASGISTSSNYSLKAGYQQMNTAYIALSASADVTLSPSIPGVSGGTSNGSTTVTVTTDSSAGYSLSIAAATAPAMQKGSDTIADYTPATADPDFTFTTGAADAHFGYTPEGSDVAQRFKDNGSSCNTGGTNTSLACWDGLSTTEEVISSTAGPNHPAGATTTVYFRVGVGGSVVQAPGTYVATTTLTALSL
jgi:hypothetical protein